VANQLEVIKELRSVAATMCFGHGDRRAATAVGPHSGNVVPVISVTLPSCGASMFQRVSDRHFTHAARRHVTHDPFNLANVR
jgi:hypothetical protein